MRCALLLAAVALAGCGGDGKYAGLTQEEASLRADQKAAELVEEDADGAMGRAGGTVPGMPRLRLGGLPAPRESEFDGRDAWLFPYEIKGAGAGFNACIYVWDDGVEVNFDRDC